MEESKRLYDVIYKPYYNQYHDVWLTIKNHDYIIRVPSIPDKTEKYLIQLANVKITNYLKRPNQSPVKVGRPRKYLYDSEEERKHYIDKAYRERKAKKALLACA
jgi:hypothetical protein